MTTVSAPPIANQDRDRILDLYRRHVNRSSATLCDLIGAPLHASSAGTKIYDPNGVEYLDCAGFGVNLIGHRHPAVIAAVKRQLDEQPLVSRPLIAPATARAAAALAGVAPTGLDHVYLTNSGAEAVEVGIKLARLQGKTRIIAMQGGFHGKTMGALSVTGRHQYRTPFEPLLPGIEFGIFGDPEDLDRRLAHDGDKTLVLVEPILGEGGVRIPPVGWLSHVRRRCTEVGAMLMIDEIQTGLGRVGAWWAADREQVVPDILLAGKILSGGVVPVGAVLSTSRVFEPLDDDPMLHSSTFAGSPLAAAAVEATIGVLKSEQLIERSAELGRELLTMVREVTAEHCPDLVQEVRGSGLLIGIDFVAGDTAIEFLMALLERNVVPSYSLNGYNILRLTPPATLDRADVAFLRTALEGAARELGRRPAFHRPAGQHHHTAAAQRPTQQEISCAS
ncbi:MAG: aminotransferase class III-fold pyridoxal phosphate-dependent enzyme [Nakamurella sp.]